MKILITGAKGFVGQNLCAALNEIKTGHDKRADHVLCADPADITLYEYDFTADEGKGMLVPTENHMINTFRLGIAGYSQQNEKGGATV